MLQFIETVPPSYNPPTTRPTNRNRIYKKNQGTLTTVKTLKIK